MYIEKDHLNNSSGLFFSLLYKIVGWLHRYKPSLSNLSACDLLRSTYHTHDLRSRQLDSQLSQFAHELSYSTILGVLSGSQRNRTKDLFTGTEMKSGFAPDCFNKSSAICKSSYSGD